jgi:hypothetical protein
VNPKHCALSAATLCAAAFVLAAASVTIK